MKPGAKPKPTADLKLHGTYRGDRHAARADAMPSQGVPVRPDNFTETEAALWDQVVPDLVARGVAAAKDTAELVSMCELWGLYRSSVTLAKSTPTDKEVRCAVTGYWAAFDRAAAKFGLSPVDNAGIILSGNDKKEKKGVATRVRA
jgi:phage terminase small subunit